MTIGTRLYSFFCGIYVGKDQYGNKFYTSKKKDYNGRNKRWVIYKGISEPSKISPEWHLWLHYTSDEVPEGSYKWQRSHLPNLTGTKYAYLPKGHILKFGARSDASADYEPWEPK